VIATTSDGIEVQARRNNVLAVPEYAGDVIPWNVVLRCNGREMRFVYYGARNRLSLSAAEIMDFLFCEAERAHLTFVQWCGALGYDPHTMRNWTVYRASQEHAAMLRRFLSNS
jgi:hypothetical protein